MVEIVIQLYQKPLHIKLWRLKKDSEYKKFIINIYKLKLILYIINYNKVIR